jgi:hypothetical protein
MPLLVGGVVLAMLGVALVWWNCRKSINPAATTRESRPAIGRG